MSQRVLIIGGRGRIGQQVARDVATYTDAEIIITGRSRDSANTDGHYVELDLGDRPWLEQVIHDLGAGAVVVHCAGPFHYRDTAVLETCIAAGVDYVDVSDHPSYTRKAIVLRQQARDAGMTAIVNTGIFPGISNSMVRRDVEKLDIPETIHLSYVVAGSGGAGITVMRTTFLGLQQPFQAWLNRDWRTVQPYRDREWIQFPPPYGRTGVYWFEMPETFTLPQAFPVQTVITKFGTVPDFYNYLTAWVARGWHPWLLKQTVVIEFLSRVSHFMTDVSDRFSGVGVAIRSQVTGQKKGCPLTVGSTLVHPHTAVAAGCGAGSVVQLLLSGHLHQPGVWSVEESLSTDRFLQTLTQRQVFLQDFHE